MEGELAGLWNTLGSLKRRMTMLEMRGCHVSVMVTKYSTIYNIYYEIYISRLRYYKCLEWILYNIMTKHTVSVTVWSF